MEQWIFNPYLQQYEENPEWTAQYQYGDPSLGTNVVLPYGGGTQHFSQGEQPFIGFPDGGQTFVSSDPDEIARYQHNARTRNWQGIGQVAGLVGGAAALGGLGGASSAAGSGANTLLPGAGVLAPTAGVPATLGQAALAGAGLPAGLGGGAWAAGGGAMAGLGGLAPGAGVLLPGAGGLGGAAGSAAGQVQAGGAGGLVGAGGGMAGIPSWLSNWGSLIGGGLGLLDSLAQPDEMTQTQGGTSQSTQGMQLPAQFQGAANSALSGLNNLYSQGYQRAQISPLIGSAANRLSGMGSNPFAMGGGNTAPTTTGFASGQYQNTAPTTSGFASGQFQNQAPTASMFAGGQTINPYLDQVFNTAADSTQSRLATEFSHAGAGALNSGSHRQARSQELQNLAAGIYAPGFESERQRQYGAAESDVQRQLALREANLGRQFGATETGLDRELSQMDSNLARMFGAQESGMDRGFNQMEANLGRQFAGTEANLGRDMSAVPLEMMLGDYMQQQQQAQLDAPWMNQDRYQQSLAGLLGMFPGTQTQNTTQTGNVTSPLFNNPFAGFAGGALLGRSLFGG